MIVYAFSFVLLTTPTGTMEAHLPPIFKLLRKSAKNNNSVDFEGHMSLNDLDKSFASREPLKGGFAKIRSYLYSSLLSSVSEFL